MHKEKMWTFFEDSGSLVTSVWGHVATEPRWVNGFVSRFSILVSTTYMSLLLMNAQFFPRLQFTSSYRLFFYFFFLFFFFFLVFCLFRAIPMAYGDSQLGVESELLATGLGHSHSNSGPEPHLWHIPQLTATPDP